jgi:DNA-binding CsgD family transcriptional regulator
MGEGQPNRFAELVGQIYDAALEPQRWPAVVEHLLPFVQAKSGMLFTPYDRIDAPGFCFPANISQNFLQQNASRYQPHDPWAMAIREAGVGRAGNLVIGDEIVPRASLLASRFFREFLKPQNTSRICVAFVFGGHEHPSVLNTALTVHRSIRSRPFSERSKERLRLLIPHLSRALGVMFRLRNAEMKIAASRSALDRLSSGIVLVDAHRDIVFTNRAAQRLFAARDGLTLAPGSSSRERLAAATPAKTAEIDRALGAALAPVRAQLPHFSVGIRVPRPSGKAPVVLNVSSLPADNGFGDGACAIVFLTDSCEAPRISQALLRRIYGLSAAELRIVERVCAGGSLGDAASALGIGQATARSQLQSAFDKTGTRRQAELVKLVLSLSSTLR